MRKKIICLFSLVWLGVLPISAATYYVSSWGDDNNHGSFSLPFKTIQKAVSVLSAGDSVVVTEGIYIEEININKNAVAGSEIVFLAQGNVIIEKPGIDIMRGIVNIGFSSHIVFKGFRIQHSNWIGINILNSNNITISNCYLFNTGASGIYVNNCNSIFINHNIIQRACWQKSPLYQSQECISLINVNGFDISYNEVFESGATLDATGGEGIDAKEGCKNGKIHHNVVHDLYRLGIYIDSWNGYTYNIEVFNNVVFRCRHGISLSSECGGPMDSIKIFNNIIYQCQQRGIEVTNYFECQGEPGLRSNILIINNTVYGNGDRGIYITEYGRRVLVRNNIVCNNSYKQFQSFAPEGEVAYDHNIYFGNNDFVLGGTNKKCLPSFVFADGGYFDVLEGSCNIDMANDSLAPLFDYNDNIRIPGTIDAGATEGASVKGLEKTLQEPVIDGKAEINWGKRQQHRLNNILSGSITPDDLEVNFKAMWDTSALYFLIGITDNDLMNDTLKKDFLKIFIDGNNNKLNTFDTNDVIYRITVNTDSPKIEEILRGYKNGEELSIKKISNSYYEMELSIPWSSMNIKPDNGKLIGLDLLYFDNDHNKPNESIVSWHTLNDSTEIIPDDLCTLQLLKEFKIDYYYNPRRTKNPPFIDANEGYWKQYNFKGNITNYFKNSIQTTDSASYWKCLYDSQNLYFWIHIYDSKLVDDSPDDMNDDGVIIYLDADNSKSPIYENNDAVFHFVYSDTGFIVKELIRGNLTGVICASNIKPNGYVLEIKIPNNLFQYFPGEVSELGIDVHLLDDFDGGNIDRQMAWWGYKSSPSPQNFGVAKNMGNYTNVDKPSETNKLLSNSCLIYPNPTKDILFVRSPEEVQKVILYEISGKMVKTIDNIRSKQFYISLENLKSGMYLINFTTTDNTKDIKYEVIIKQ